MKILLIMPWIRQGGAELIAVQTAWELDKLGHRVRLATLFVDTSQMNPLAQKINYVLPSRWIANLCQRSKIFLYFVGPFFLFWLTLKNTNWADILFPHSLPSSWMAVVLGKIYKKKVVWLCNEPPKKRKIDELGLADGIMWLVADSFLDKFFAKRIERIIVYSKAVAQEVKERYGKEAALVRLGIDFKFFSQKENKEIVFLKRQYRLKNKFILLMVGKLHPQKNQHLGIEVLAKILPKIKNAVLVLVGEGPEEEKLKSKIKNLKLKNKVIFTGFCQPEIVRAWYALSDLVLFPSVGQTATVSQSWGFVPFEALCQKKISIVSTNSGAAEVLGRENLGVVCQPTVKDFFRTVLSVLGKRKEHKEMGKRGYFYVKNNLSWEKWGREIDGILSKVV